VIPLNRKVLFCATVDYHFKAFHLPYMKWFQENRWEVHVAANGDMKLPFVDKKYNLPMQRSPFDTRNLTAYKQLKEIIDNNDYSIVHCHTPIGGLLARLASRKARENGTKVIYTAHGFHFCEGSPILNWIVYYPIERYLAHYTDCLITINQEDYTRAVNHRFQAGRIEHVHGVGIDIERFKPINEEIKQEYRQKHGYKQNEFLMFYAAEFNQNKNQQFLIRALFKLKDKVPYARLLLAGNGSMMNYCQKLSRELGVSEMVDFLGHLDNIDEMLPMCDLVVAASFREGLPVNVMEGMACGLPVIASVNRGHRELVYNDKSGWLVGSEDVEALSGKIELIAKNKGLKNKLGNFGREIVENKYSIHKVLNEMSAIYSSFMV
jgi:glycosyltransferase EpsD